MITERPLVAKSDGKNYQTNPTNGYISHWTDGFLGHLACGSTTHRFAAFPQKDDAVAK